MQDDMTVRPATLGDAEAIYALVDRHRDELVPRSLGSIVESIDRFFVAECGGEPAGCASYQIHPEIGDAEAATVEIVSVAVESRFRRRGIGRRLVEAVVDGTRRFRPREVMVLTFAPGFFRKLDFVEFPKTEIMHKLYTGCINCTKHMNPYTCPEVAMRRRVEH
ncbi:MAG: GNAT family N-acetyltransferase [Kiritimatiellae bacterium]|nr:GNAT family N-acetyltransferase [Kiritimatiellia bacterium]